MQILQTGGREGEKKREGERRVLSKAPPPGLRACATVPQHECACAPVCDDGTGEGGTGKDERGVLWAPHGRTCRLAPPRHPFIYISSLPCFGRGRLYYYFYLFIYVWLYFSSAIIFFPSPYFFSFCLSIPLLNFFPLVSHLPLSLCLMPPSDSRASGVILPINHERSRLRPGSDLLSADGKRPKQRKGTFALSAQSPPPSRSGEIQFSPSKTVIAPGSYLSHRKMC